MFHQNLPLLTCLILLPLIGALLIFVFIRSGEAMSQNARYAALWTTLITFFASLMLWDGFVTGTGEFQFVERVAWFKDLGIDYYLGIDGFSLLLILLTTFLMPICILATWKNVTKRVAECMIAFLVLESFVIGVFSALDMVLFYLFFEGMLIPMFLIIGVWGGDNRIYAAYKFFLYTLLGSVLFLIAILYLYLQFGTTSIPEMMAQAPYLSSDVQKWLWLAMFISFAVKVPMWPVHTWLPDAHVQAPTAGSVILAGVLLKMGGYGFLRFSLPMLPDASHYFAPLVFTLSVIAVVYTSLVALRQRDMKKLIAYSSIAHMGFVTAGLFVFNKQGIQGSMIQMISHGLVSGALFLCIGVLYDRVHSREIARYGGVVEVMPYYAALFLFFIMASVGLPTTSGFVGEFLVLAGSFLHSSWLALGLASGMILGAAYALWLYRKVIYGALQKTELEKLADLERREYAMLVPILVMVLWLGLYPKPFIDVLDASTDKLIQQVTILEQANQMVELSPTTSQNLMEGM